MKKRRKTLRRRQRCPWCHGEMKPHFYDIQGQALDALRCTACDFFVIALAQEATPPDSGADRISSPADDPDQTAVRRAFTAG